MSGKPADINNSQETNDDYLLFEEWLTYCKLEGLEAKTLRGYRYNVERFLWWWHHTGLADRLGAHPRNITLREARAFATYLRDPAENRWDLPGSKCTLAPATVSNYSRPLKVWFNWLEEEGHIPATPFTKAVKFTTRKTDKVIKHVGVDDLAKLFAYLTEPARLKTYRGCRDMAVITLFLDSGIRLGELVSLRLCDLDMSNMRCVIRGKTGQRYALFSERCKDTLTAYTKLRRLQGGGETEPLWFSVDGYPLTQEGLVTSIRRIEQKSGVRFHPHKLRHTFALLMSRNVSVFELKELLGHSTITTTQIYVQQNIDLLGDRYRPHAPLSELQDTLPGMNKNRRGRPRNSIRN